MTIRERIAAAAARPRLVKVEVPGLGEVNIRRISAREFMDATAGMSEGHSLAMVAAAVVDDEGKQVFTSAKDEALTGDWGVCEALIMAVQRVNSMQPAAEAGAKPEGKSQGDAETK